MSQLSEERIEELSVAFPFDGDFARAMYAEGYKAGQKRMRERAADIANFLEQYTCAKGIRNLEIEEPK